MNSAFYHSWFWFLSSRRGAEDYCFNVLWVGPGGDPEIYRQISKANHLTPRGPLWIQIVLKSGHKGVLFFFVPLGISFLLFPLLSLSLSLYVYFYICLCVCRYLSFEFSLYLHLSPILFVPVCLFLSIYRYLILSMYRYLILSMYFSLSPYVSPIPISLSFSLSVSFLYSLLYLSFPPKTNFLHWYVRSFPFLICNDAF